MSMIGYFLAVKPERGEELAHDPAAVGTFVHEAIEDQDELGQDFLDLDKSWQAIHFLLTGDVEGGDAPLAWAVLAPTTIGEDLGYGPARLLSPDEVTEVSKALAPITADKMKRRFNKETLNERNVYPNAWRADDADYIAENFTQLKKLYESAARRRMSIVQWIS